MIWRRYPLLNAFVGFSVGIVLADLTVISLSIFFIYILVFLTLALLVWRRSNKFFVGILILVYMASGATHYRLYTEGAPLLLEGQNLPSEEQRFVFTLIETPYFKGKTLRTKAKVLISQGAEWSPHRAQLYLQRDSLSTKLCSGDQIIYRGNLKLIEGSLNTEAFDFRHHMALQKVAYSAYLRSGDWQLLASPNKVNLQTIADGIRGRLMLYLSNWPIEERERRVAQALLLGYRHDIDRELLADFGNAGVTHVLAVSGLHVGILYLFATKLLFFLGSGRRSELLRSLIILLILWIYALITGLSPSIMRAATMFSFVAIGGAFKRSVSIYNTLLASAFFLLLIKPTLLLNAGFQLSYAAVFSIVLIYPLLQKIWQPRYWILKQLWSIAAVSIAAQFFTFPIALYYFHQFAGSFLLANIIVIPLVTLVMYIGIVILVFESFGLSPPFLQDVFGRLLHLMNDSVGAMDDVSRKLLISDVWIGWPELLLIYLLLGFGIYWILHRTYGALFTCGIVFLGLHVYTTAIDIQRSCSSELILFSMDNRRVIGIRAGKELFLIAGQSFDIEDRRIVPYIQSNALKIADVICWNENYRCIYFGKSGPIVQMEGFSIGLVEGNYAKGPDYWMVGRNTPPKVEDINTIPEGVFYYGRSTPIRWREWCMDQGISFACLGEGYQQIKLGTSCLIHF